MAALGDASFIDCNLKEADLNCSDLCGAKFSGANLIKTKISKADLKSTVFESCVFESTDFHCSDLRGVCFDGQRLSGVRLNMAGLEGASFKNAVLQGVSFRHVAKKCLRKSCFDGASMDKLTYVVLKANGADLSKVTVI